MALGKSSPLDKPARKYSELFDENGNPIYDITNTSMANMVSPYYGGDKQMQAEVDKARRFAESKGGKLASQSREAYQKFYEPVITQFDANSSYYAEEAQPLGKSGDVYPMIKIKGGEALAEQRNRLKKYKAGSMAPAEKNEFERFLKENGYDLNSYEKHLGKNFVASALEHEAGHHGTSPFAYGNGGPMYAVKNANDKGEPSNYMAEPGELVNVIGRIQRERFKKGEGRFENEEDLKNYVKKTPYKKAIEGYSPEAIRGWKTLYEEQDSSKPDIKWLLDYASELAPALVKNKKSTGLGSYS